MSGGADREATPGLGAQAISQAGCLPAAQCVSLLSGCAVALVLQSRLNTQTAEPGTGSRLLLTNSQPAQRASAGALARQFLVQISGSPLLEVQPLHTFCGRSGFPLCPPALRGSNRFPISRQAFILS